MKRSFFTYLSVMATSVLWAQTEGAGEILINTQEDPTSIVTIADIISMEEADTGSDNKEPGKRDGGSSYINIGYNLGCLNPKYVFRLGYDYHWNVAPKFNNDWGVSLQAGHTYRLHKSPLFHLLFLNLDATYADINFSHYKAERADKVYDSRQLWYKENESGATTGSYHFIPWCLEKYEVNCGLTAGPSITIDPFRSNKNLRHLRFNLFYHVGYHLSLMWMQNNRNLDANPNATTSTAFNVVNDNVKLNYGYGFTNNFGLNIIWKSIGIGIDKRLGYIDYKSFQKNIYGNESYRFIDDVTRFYIQVRF